VDAEQTSPEVREALEELQLYLSDSIPPLVAAGSIELLLRQPPDVMASAIQGWTGAQYRRKEATSVAVSDYLFHAVRKVHLMGEYRLVPAETLASFLGELKRAVVAYCPEEDRELLGENLKRLDEAAASTSAAPVSALFRQIGGERVSSAGGPAPAAASIASGELALRRFSTLLQRMEAEVARAGAGRGKPLPETLAVAARRSETAREIEEYLARLRGMGLEVGTADVFQALAKTLPEWTPPASGAQWPAPGNPSHAVEAMRRMVVEAEDPVEGARRFQELVRAAIDRFNEGSLPQAASAIDLALQLLGEKKVDAGTVEVARRKGGEALDAEKLRRFAENESTHAPLKKILTFFTALSPQGLLEDLAREPKRERRRLLLALLEVHGEPARAAAFEALSAPFRELGPEQWYFRRNLLYLLRRIPRPPEAPLEDEIEVTVRHARIDLPPPLVKEAVANLGQLRHEKAEVALAQLLVDLEAAARDKSADSTADPREVQGLLDRVVSALARVGTPGARRAVLEHSLSKDPKLGDTMARAAELGTQDLSDDPDFVNEVLGVVKANAPVKVLGLVLHQNENSLLRAIGILSGTPSPAVRSAFEEIASRFPEKEIGKAAARSLAGFRKAGPEAAAAPPAPSLSGDLEVFGLPALMQSLADSGASGSLTVSDPKGALVGTIRLTGGKLRSCRAGHLRGREAYFQLLERPTPGTFQFIRSERPPESGDATATGTLYDVLPLTMEAMRRHDELREAAVLVPDDVLLKATDVPPVPHPGEKDGMLIKGLWTRVKGGATARQCESEIEADSYRIRRILAHWVEQGSLKPAQA